MDEKINAEVVNVPLSDTLLNKVIEEVGVVPLMGIGLLIFAGGAIGGVIGIKIFVK